MKIYIVNHIADHDYETTLFVGTDKDLCKQVTDKFLKANHSGQWIGQILSGADKERYVVSQYRFYLGYEWLEILEFEDNTIVE